MNPQDLPEEVHILACVPVDTSRLPKLETDPPEITDLYRQELCDDCDEPIWVGPRQATVRALEEGPVLTLCYMCAARTYVEVKRDDDAREPRLVNLGGGAEVEGTLRPEEKIGFVSLDKEEFPFTLELFRTDTGEVLWRQEVTGPGALNIPGYGGQGFTVGVRTVGPKGSTTFTPY